MEFAEADALVKSIDLSNFPAQIKLRLGGDERGLCISVSMAVTGIETGQPTVVNESRLITGEKLHKLTRDELSDFVYRLVEGVVVHELKECFRVNGKQIFHPHDK